MAVKISDICVTCGACIDECPVEAIVDDNENPTGERIYYVYADKCVECVGYNDVPACADVCPTAGCIVWDNINPKRNEIQDELRNGRCAVVQ